MANYFLNDRGQDVLLLAGNIFRFIPVCMDFLKGMLLVFIHRKIFLGFR